MRREQAEARIVDLLKAKLYTREAVARLVEAVNQSLRQRQPVAPAERELWQAELRQVRTRLDGLRRFVEQGDSSSKVREWLTDVELKEGSLVGKIAALEPQARRRSLRPHPRVVEGYLEKLQATLQKAGPRARQRLHADVE